MRDEDEQKEMRPIILHDLMTYIRSETEKEHDYDSSADALWHVAVAAFNYAAHKVGASASQAGYAQLEFLRVMRRLEGPFAIIDGTNMLYPQTDVRDKVETYLQKWEPWAVGEARKLLSENTPSKTFVHPDVRAHWEKLASKAPQIINDKIEKIKESDGGK